MTRIFIWPDASWMYAEDHCDVMDKWRGDDFVDLHTGLTNERDIDSLAEQFVHWEYQHETPTQEDK